MTNPYTCRLLIRIDRWAYLLKGENVAWMEGRLCFLYLHFDDGTFHGAECPTHFPGWMFIRAAQIQNRWMWTRRILSA